jgi:hypothetical protein
MNLRIGRLGQLLAPGYGWCLRCLTPWVFVSYHATDFGHQGKGCLPLCQKCWDELTPEQRLPFYQELIELWHQAPCDLSFDDEWAQVKDAVLKGG